MTNQGRFWSWVTNGIITCLHKWLIQLWAEIIGSSYAAKWLKVVTFVLINLVSRCFCKIANIFTQQKSTIKCKQSSNFSEGQTTNDASSSEVNWPLQSLFLICKFSYCLLTLQGSFSLRLRVSRILAVFTMGDPALFLESHIHCAPLISWGVRLSQRRRNGHEPQNKTLCWSLITFNLVQVRFLPL